MRRLFTFGCSYTSWYWPTWADLLGRSYDYSENWAVRGLGNRAIVERLSECLLKNKVTKDDTVIVQWTDFHRYDTHYPGINQRSNWRSGGSLLVKPVEIAYIKDSWREDSYTMHSMNFINLGINLLKSYGCKWYITSSVDLTQDIDRFPEMSFYKSLFENYEWIEPIQSYVDKQNYQGIQCLKFEPDPLLRVWRTGIELDLHPTSDLHLAWLEKNFKDKLDVSFDTEFIQAARDYIFVAPLDFSNKELFKEFKGFRSDPTILGL
jgi:hypothetical protein